MKLLALTIDAINPKTDPIKIKTPGGIPTGGFSGGENSLGNHLLQWGFIIMFAIVILLALFYFIYGGIQWITSGGDKTKVQAARNKMVYSIIGLVISLLAFILVSFVGRIFGVILF